MFLGYNLKFENFKFPLTPRYFIVRIFKRVFLLVYLLLNQMLYFVYMFNIATVFEFKIKKYIFMYFHLFIRQKVIYFQTKTDLIRSNFSLIKMKNAVLSIQYINFM